MKTYNLHQNDPENYEQPKSVKRVLTLYNFQVRCELGIYT